MKTVILTLKNELVFARPDLGEEEIASLRRSFSNAGRIKSICFVQGKLGTVVWWESVVWDLGEQRG